MATLVVKASFPNRSICLPKRDHPINVNVEEQLCRLRSSSQAATTSICHKVSDLKQLYEHVNDVLQLPLTQQALFNEKNNKMVDNFMDGCLLLLDICNTTRYVFSQMKECNQELESSLSRRRCGETGFASEVKAYMISRKKSNKMIVKCLNSLERMQKNCKSAPLQNCSTLNMLKGVEQASLNMFESLLCVVSQPKRILTPKSLMSRLFESKNGNKMQKLGSKLVLWCRSNKDIDFAKAKRVLKGL